MDNMNHSEDWNKIMNGTAYKSEDYMKLVQEYNPAPQKPAKYKIWLLNDECVIEEMWNFILQQYFNIKNTETTSYINKLRTEGQVSCGSFTREVAENKIMKVIDFSHSSGFHLKCIMCKEY